MHAEYQETVHLRSRIHARSRHDQIGHYRLRTEGGSPPDILGYAHGHETHLQQVGFAPLLLEVQGCFASMLGQKRTRGRTQALCGAHIHQVYDWSSRADTLHYVQNQ
jgi:hypothetical protein